MLVISERSGPVEIVTLNRPEAANSLNPPLLAELGTTLQRAMDDDGVRVVVVTGAGDRVFCAGMDLAALDQFNQQPAEGADPDGAATLARFLAGSFPKPLVAAVNGAAVGGGMELAMACDLLVAAEHARFGLPEVKRGLFAAGGGTLLPARIPQALALELGLTGRLMGADEAARAGLVNRVVPADRVMAVATELAAEVASNGPLGVQLTKRLMRQAAGPGAGVGLATDQDRRLVFGSDDAREGATAFLEKRAPVFRGR